MRISVVLAALAFAGAGQAFAGDVVIHAGRLIDGVSKTERSQVSILVHDVASPA